MQTLSDRLPDIRRRIAEAEHRLGELASCPADRAMAAMLAESVTATLKLLREHEARLESRKPPAQPSNGRR
jgi:hypothetical protein